MQTESLDKQHTETLLDVVFGVVIAIALTDLPRLVVGVYESRDPEAVTSVVLLVSSLIFCAFYWVEVRHFIDQQHAFDKAIECGRGEEFDAGVPVPLASFLLGTLLMMTLASAILTFSRQESFKGFLLASALFWTADLGGALLLRRSYRPFRTRIEGIRKQAAEEHGWFLGHIDSRFFVLYGLLNVGFFLLLWLLSRSVGTVPEVQLLLAVLVLALTLFRHLAWRSKIYVWWVRRVPRPAGTAT